MHDHRSLLLCAELTYTLSIRECVMRLATSHEATCNAEVAPWDRAQRT